MRPHILLVDDVDTVRESIASMLAPRYSVEVASRATEALEILRARGGLAVVVTDFAMPGGNGIELLRRVRSEWPETVGIVLSGDLDARSAERAIADGDVFRFVAKPCSFEALSIEIDAALARHRLLVLDAEAAELTQFKSESLASLNSILEERSRRQMRSLVRLNELALQLNSATSLHGMACHAARAVHELLDGRGVLVQLYSQHQQDSVEASSGAEMSASLDVVHVSDGNRALGEITIDVSRPLGSTDRTVLDSVAASVGVAAQNELRRLERDRAHEALILALASLSETRDAGTGRHLERVAEYCRLVAHGLREDGVEVEALTDGWIADLARASALHDIGKVGVPDSILLKPGRLSEEEWVVMKRHAELGARTLERVIEDVGPHRLLVLARDIAACHHEQWDGSGYPRGLAGLEIPLCARIMAIADVYDALTTVRPYKRAWEHEEAMAWIEERAGKHFDPAVVGSFVRREGLVDAIRRKLADDTSDDASVERSVWAA